MVLVGKIKTTVIKQETEASAICVDCAWSADGEGCEEKARTHALEKAHEVTVRVRETVVKQLTGKG